MAYYLQPIKRLHKQVKLFSQAVIKSLQIDKFLIYNLKSSEGVNYETASFIGFAFYILFFELFLG